MECKFLFLEIHQALLQGFLRRTLLPDPLFPFNRISTIYFDTPDLRAYRETRRGIPRRAKGRLRWYENANREQLEGVVPCYLEVKRKEGALRYKERRRFALAAAALTTDPLDDRDVVVVGRQLLRLLPARSVLPVLLMKYDRHRFVDPGSGDRIALDTKIHCMAARRGIFPSPRTIWLRPGVLEVKGRLGNLPESLSPLRELLTRRSFSKYSRCCDRLLEPLRRSF